MKAFAKSIDALAHFYRTNLTTGLSSQEAKDRINTFGLNVLPRSYGKSLLLIFLNQFKSPLIYILLIASFLMFLLGDYKDAFVISSILLFNSIIGGIQEKKAQTTLLNLQQYLPINATVLREGSQHIIDAQFLVPGDIIYVRQGERVPADARIMNDHNLKVDEAVLTGESEPIEKGTKELPENTPIYNQNNMIFSGTNILAGAAYAIVTATGPQTEFGKINKAIKTEETDIPLKKQLDKLSKWVILIIFCFCIILFIYALIHGKSLNETLATLIALFVAIIPEGLPIVFTIILATGVYRLAQEKVLVKHLDAVEGLGSVDTIVLDKTGTLTKNQLTILKVFTDNKFYTVTGEGYSSEGQVFYKDQIISESELHSKIYLLAKALALLNQSSLEYDDKLKSFKIRGEPIEVAFGILAQKMGINITMLKQEFELVEHVPFDHALYLHIVWYKKERKLFCFTSGSPEVILNACNLANGTESNALKTLVEEGFRVVGIAYKELDESHPLVENYRDFFIKQLMGQLDFLGFCAMQDIIRHEVNPMILDVQKSGIEVLMATGDHKKTALFVAKETGIFQEGDEVIEGKDLENLTDEELLKKIDKIKIYARFLPQDKLRLIKLLRKQNKIIAMTGDGINDVPSIIGADLGIAMGTSGTDFTRDAADLILLDDSFASIINAIKEGRHIFYTLRRVILYFFATNLSEVLLLLFTLALDLPLPLLPVHIIWINLVTDGFLDLGLAMEPQEKNIIKNQWLRTVQKLGLFNKYLLLKILYQAIPMALLTTAVFTKFFTANLAKARTLTLTCMCLFQWFNAWNCRSETRSLFSLNFFANIWLLLATLAVILLQVLILYVPFFQHIFNVVPLTLYEWVLLIATSSSIIWLEEIRKLIFRKWHTKNPQTAYHK